MNVVVVGLGSMGRRRIRLIKKYDNSVNIIGIDTNAERRSMSERKYNIKTSENLEDVLHSNYIDCAFICTSPLSHNKLINICLINNLHVFTELNLVTDGYEENVNLANVKGRILFLSSTFLYRAEIKKIKEFVEKQIKNLNYVYHVGQYLPDWHPWENFEDFFVVDKKTNGCREIFAIELPWIIETFGQIKNMIAKKNKISSLHLDYNDNYIVIIEHISGHKGVFVVDVVSRKPVRNLEIFGEDLFISWDGSAEGLKILNLENKQEVNIQLYDEVDQLDQYSKFVVENAYFDEIVSFFESIKHSCDPIYDFQRDKKILEIIDQIEA